MHAAPAADRFAYRQPAAPASRSRAMSTRRPRAPGSSEAAHQRLKGHLEDVVGALSDRLDDKFDRLDSRLSRMEHDIGVGREDRSTLRSDINETRRDLGELRDALNLRVAPTVQTSAKMAISNAAKSWPARLAAACLLFTTTIVGLNNIPDGLRWLEKAYTILRGADAPTPKVDAKSGR